MTSLPPSSISQGTYKSPSWFKGRVWQGSESTCETRKIVVVSFGKHNLPQMVIRKKEIRSNGKWGKSQGKTVDTKCVPQDPAHLLLCYSCFQSSPATEGKSIILYHGASHRYPVAQPWGAQGHILSGFSFSKWHSGRVWRCHSNR